MAVIQHLTTKATQILNLQHRVGRDKTNQLYINEQDVSRSHATIYWDKNQWMLRDHSRNGTRVNNRLVCQNITRLEAGHQIQFGSTENTIWELTNDGPPKSYLEPLVNNKNVLELTNGLMYPDANQPIASFFLSQNMKWAVDNGVSTEELRHQQRFMLHDVEWCFYENDPVTETIDNLKIVEQASLIFMLSPDEESVEVKIAVNQLELSLGERVYNYLLLQLARKRQFDQEGNITTSEQQSIAQGWLSIEALLIQLSKELQKDIDKNYLNIMIHRFREHIRNIQPYGHLFTNIIERKRGMIRLNHPNISIQKNNQLQYN